MKFIASFEPFRRQIVRTVDIGHPSSANCLFHILDPVNDLGQRVGALEFAGYFQNVVFGICRDARRYEGRKNASQSEKADALPVRDLEAGILDIENRACFRSAARAFDTGDGHLKVFQVHVIFSCLNWLRLDVLLPSSVYPITEAVSVLSKESTHSAESVALPLHPFPVMLPLSSWGQNPLSTSVLVYWNQLSYIGTSSEQVRPESATPPMAYSDGIHSISM